MAAAPPPQQGSGGQQDSGLGPFWIIAALFFALYVVWSNYHTEIVGSFLKLKYYEALAIVYVDPSIDPLARMLGNLTPAEYAKIDPDQVIAISEAVGRYWRWPVLAFCILGGGFIYKRSPRLHYRRMYTMQSLIDAEEGDWPQITPVVKINLVKTHLDEGPWASAQTPLQFVKKYKIFKEVPAESIEPMLAHKMKRYIALLPEQAYRVLSMQMGKLWTGIDKQPIYIQALFAAFAAKHAGKTEIAANLLIQISRSSAAGKLNFAGVKQLLNKHVNEKKIQEICANHAYMLTVMASMLELARQDGVLSSADFLWLKPLDRQLWYMLNTVGRQTAYVEVAAAYAHWRAEIEFGRKIKVPMVGEAVKALDVALKDILYVPEDL
ncbi:MAG: type IVB secretion system coupling complex protein DotM/IcmP [Gammaproteobacteria bacterium]|nr:type IVB secretion system coupling complex protein DotM/IcmP [Gammaproteobacteria bacterium]